MSWTGCMFGGALIERGPMTTGCWVRCVGSPFKFHSPARLPRSAHQGGFAEFRYWYVRKNQETWKEGRLCATTVWKKLSIQHKYHWYLLKRAMSIVNGSRLQGCVRKRVQLGPDGIDQVHCDGNSPGISRPDEVLALGLLLTYQPTLGVDDPQVLAWIRDGMGRDQLRHELTTRPAHRTYFQGFSQFIQHMRTSLGFASCCACMEMGDQSRFAAQVHCHAYLGFLRKESSLMFAKQISVRLSALMFCNVKPYVVVTRGLRGRRLQDSVAQAMHYVVGPKSAGVFRVTDLEPIQDACATLHECALTLHHKCSMVRIVSHSVVFAVRFVPDWFALGIFGSPRTCVLH